MTRPGDAAVVGLLLLFAVGWLAAWFLGLSGGPRERRDDGVALMLFVLIFGPPLWAFWCVERIVRRRL